MQSTRLIYPMVLTLLGVSLCCCESAVDLDEPAVGGSEVSFSADGIESDVWSRGIATDINNIDFGVFCCKTDPNIDYYTNQIFTPWNFDNRKVFRSEGKWKYDDLVSWPSDGSKLSFVAYAPYTSTIGDPTGPSTSLSVPDGFINAQTAINYANSGNNPYLIYKRGAYGNIDLMWAQCLNRYWTGENTAVRLTFKHLTSRLKFSVECDETLSSAILTDINATLGNAYSSAAVDLRTGEWNYDGTLHSGLPQQEDNTLTFVSPTDEINIANNPFSLRQITGSLNESDWYLIPNKPSDNNDVTTISMTFQIKSYTFTDDPDHPDNDPGVGPLTVSAKVHLVAGKSYNACLVLSEDLVSVHLEITDVTVEPLYEDINIWADVSDPDDEYINESGKETDTEGNIKETDSEGNILP